MAILSTILLLTSIYAAMSTEFTVPQPSRRSGSNQSTGNRPPASSSSHTSNTQWYITASVSMAVLLLGVGLLTFVCLHARKSRRKDIEAQALKLRSSTTYQKSKARPRMSDIIGVSSRPGYGEEQGHDSSRDQEQGLLNDAAGATSDRYRSPPLSGESPISPKYYDRPRSNSPPAPVRYLRTVNEDGYRESNPDSDHAGPSRPILHHTYSSPPPVLTIEDATPIEPVSTNDVFRPPSPARRDSTTVPEAIHKPDPAYSPELPPLQDQSHQQARLRVQRQTSPRPLSLLSGQTEG